MWLVVGALLLLVAGGDGSGAGYKDQHGVTWRVWREGPFWSVATKGYGGKFTHVTGFTTRAQAIEIIKGNAANRDPKTGAIL